MIKHIFTRGELLALFARLAIHVALHQYVRKSHLAVRAQAVIWLKTNPRVSQFSVELVKEIHTRAHTIKSDGYS